MFENNIEDKMKINEYSDNPNINESWVQLNFMEQKVVSYIANNNGATREEISKVIEREKTSTINILNKLIDKNLIV